MRGFGWIGRRIDRAVGVVDRNLRTVYGGAQVDEQSAGTQHERAEHRLSGVQGQYEVHRDATGRTYLVSKPVEQDDDGGR